MDKKQINRIIAKEGLIIIGLGIALYLLLRVFTQIPIVFPKYRLAFVNGQTCTINIYPEIRSGYNSKELMEEALNPAPKLIKKRIKEFMDTAGIKATLKGSRCVNPGAIYRSRLFVRFLNKPFIFKIFILYLTLLLIRFVAWAVGIFGERRVKNNGKN
ncbi:MAG: hypothetical protein PHH68_03680 [Candidatus Omnitrophica bacterium]|jgi:hypothetical protein|nr:hypothetical protein [Candidatus Omnitrophota bacterium]MDD5079409.1 hypothetical protein [Candidatus Omnitrophota bacterium]